MSTDVNTVVVNILDKAYQVSCPPEQQPELEASARHLDNQMRSIRESGKVIGLDRIAVMAALNITHDLLAQEPDPGESAYIGEDESRRLTTKVETALQRFRQMEL